MNFDYARFFAENFQIVDKQANFVPLILNDVQARYLREKREKNIILKARQQGFSTVIDACIAAKFLLKPNYRALITADIADNAAGLLARLKLFIKSYEEKNHVIIPKDRNSKYELHNTAMNSMILIGTAQNVDVGRSRTYDEWHASEFAFYPKPALILNSAAQAVVPGGQVNIESTANGFNEYKELWDDSVLGANVYNPMFFAASEFYPADFLNSKRKELGKFFAQEYPETPQEAFLTSGQMYFETDALTYYLKNVKTPLGRKD